MNVGIDLDNTLVDYEAAFLAAAECLQIGRRASVKSKRQIREFLRSEPEGERTWQRLQGLAYGRYVQSHAKLYPGVKRFLWRCRQQGHRVTVVSHKTEFGHGDVDRVSLRRVATEFLAAQGLLGPPDSPIEEVIFMATREEKIACIKNQRFDWFIDDLPEVISELSEIAGLKTILFDSAENSSGMSFSDWQQIDAMINGGWTFPEIKQLVRQLMNREATAIEKLSSGGNAGVYRMTISDTSLAKLKIYPIDSHHDRLFSEFTATRGISTLGAKCVSRPLAQDIQLGVGVYEWVAGDPVQIPVQKDLESSLEFLDSLHAMRNAPQFFDVPLASAACLSGRDIETQIRNRVAQFELPRMQHSGLEDFFADAFLPTFEELLKLARNEWPRSIGFDSPLSKAEQTLSPSDFGFHNAIRRSDGSLAFLDFEYFGWDDPVKLMSDFSFHPGMNLSDEQKSFWLKGALQVYGEHLAERLNVCRPLYGLIWCLIFLNDYRPEIWQRRLLADDSRQACRQAMLDRQLARAQALLHNIQLNHTNSIAETYH